MSLTENVQFGIFTPPHQVDYADLLRVWTEADETPEIAHAWLFDHLIPIAGDVTGPVLEGWTLLSALAAQTKRLRIGVMVTSNRFRPPSMLAKIAATVDVVSGGRLEFGIGSGSRPGHPVARHEYTSNGLPYHDADHAVASLAEASTLIRRLWAEEEPFDFDGDFYRLERAFANPKPVQRPHPPIVIGGRAKATLRVVAEHADVWNIPGGDIEDMVRRSEMLDGYCAENGRDPKEITRSTVLGVSYDQPGQTRAAVKEAVDAGFGHIVLMLPTPYPDNVVRWVVDEIVTPTAS